MEYLASRGIETIVGVSEEACCRLNEAFIKFITTGIPFVMLKCASTLDGRIATRTGDSKWITNTRSRQFVHGLRHAVDAIMVGIGTVAKDNPSLTTRLEATECSDPVRIILDTHLSISPDSRLLHLSSVSDTIIVSDSSVSPDKRKTIEKTGARVLTLDCPEGRIDLKSLVKELGKTGITSLLIEGGSRVNGSALRAGIVDKIYMFYAPKLCAGDDGIPICSGPAVSLMKDCMEVHSVSVHRFEDDIMIEGYLGKR